MSEFSCGCDASHEIDELAAAIARIRAMHVKDASGFCLACDYGWPCDTVKALDGGEESLVLKDALAKITQVIEIAMSGRGYVPGRAVVKAIRNILSNAARGGEPAPDSQRFRYGFGNNISSAWNTILDDSDDEKVVSGNYDDNVTDAGDTPHPATNWVRKPLQTGDADTPATTPPGDINP